MGWRLCFASSGLLILAGGPLHPGGSMADMLAHENWVLSHTLVTLGFAAMLAGLVLLSRTADAERAVRGSLRFAIAGTALQLVEMIFHTLAYVDHANLVAGQSTPVLSTHLILSVLLYPLFGIAMVAFIIHATRQRVFGGRWLAWLGVIGAAAHGAAAPLVVAFEVPWARILFPMVILLALWLLIVAIAPVGVRSLVRRTA